MNILKIKRLIGKITIPFGLSTWTTLFSFLFIGNILINNIQDIRDISFDHLSFLYITLSLFFSILSVYINALAWRSLLYWIDSNKSKQIALISLYIRTNILKYLPGGIWHFFERYRVLNLSLEKRIAIRAVILEPLLMVSAALIFVPIGQWMHGLSLFLFLPALVIFSKWFDPILEMIEKFKFKKLIRIDLAIDTYRDKINITRVKKYPLNSLLIEAAFIVFRFISFYFCLKSLFNQFDINVIYLLSSFSLSWSIGLIVPGAPGGAGVFESFLIFQVGNYFPKGSFIAFLLLYRIIVTASDFLSTTLNSFLTYKKVINSR